MYTNNTHIFKKLKTVNMAHLSVHFAQDDEEQPLYSAPARILFKPGQLNVQKAKYIKRVIVRCIKHLPVPYIVEIPKSGNSRFEISPIGRLSPDEWQKGIIDSGMEGIALSVIYTHPAAGEADYVYDNFQHVVYIHTPEHTLSIVIKAIRNDQEDELLPERLPKPTRPLEGDFPVLRVATALSPPYRERNGFNDDDFETEFAESLNIDGFATAMPDYPQSPPRNEKNDEVIVNGKIVDADELDYYQSLLKNGNSNDNDNSSNNDNSYRNDNNNNNGKIKNNKHETSRNIVDDWKKKNEQYLPSVIEEEGEEEDEEGDVEEAAMKEGKEAVVDSIEDARAMIRSMRMGRSTRISTSTLAKNGSNIIAQAGKASFKLNKSSSKKKGKHSNEEMNFYKTFLKREKDKKAKQDLGKNKYDVSKNRDRAKLVDERIEKEFPLLAKARRRLRNNGGGKFTLNESSTFNKSSLSSKSRGMNSPSRTQLSRIVFSSSSDEENEIFDEINVVDQSYELPTNEINNNSTNNIENTEESAINWSSDDDDNDDYFDRDIPKQSPSIVMDAEERRFYQTLALGRTKKQAIKRINKNDSAKLYSTYGLSPRSNTNNNNNNNNNMKIDDDEQIQRAYADRLRAALSDVTIEKESQNIDKAYGRNRFAVRKRNSKKRYLRKDQKLINVKDWL